MDYPADIGLPLAVKDGAAGGAGGALQADAGFGSKGRIAGKAGEKVLFFGFGFEPDHLFL